MAKPVLFSVIYNSINQLPFLTAVTRASQATSMLAMSGEKLQIELQKTQARLQSTQVRLGSLERESDSLSTSITDNIDTVFKAQKAYTDLSAKVATYTTKMQAAQAANNNRSANAYKNLIDQNNKAIEKLKTTITALNPAITEEGHRFDYVAAQVSVKNARIKELNVTMDKLNKSVAASQPQNPFQKFWVDAVKAYDTIDKVISAVNKVTMTMERARRSTHRVINVTNDIWSIFTGHHLIGNAKRGESSSGAGSGDGGMGALGAAASAAAPEITPFVAATQAISFAMNAVSVAVGNVISGIVSFIGNLITSAVTGFASALGGLAQQAVTVVANYERSTLALKAMVAQETRSKDTTIGMTAALAGASAPAQQLMKWIEKLAILSPFSEDDVKQTFFLAKSYGFLAGDAQVLTTAILNWAAATGKSGDEMQRVILATGQMRSTGKLLGNDLMQLASVGVNLKEILSRKLGISIVEVTKKIEQGTISATDAIKAMVDTMNGDWGQAAKDQAGTLQGLLSSIQDLVPRFLREFFGPLDANTGKLKGILGAIQPYLQKFVDFLSSDSLLQSVRNVGVYLGELASNALKWGESFVNQYTQGLSNGLKNLMQWIANVGRQLARWLQPHSPPLVAPEIDQWGAKTAEMYFSGFASYNSAQVFSDIAAKIEGAIRGTFVEGADNSSKLKFLVDIQSSIQNIANTIAITGSTAGTGLGTIIANAGAAGQALLGYINAYARFQIAQAGVASAQKSLNDVTTQYDGQLKDVQKQLNAITNAQQLVTEGRELKNLQRIMNDPNASQARKDQAALQIKQIQLTQKQRQLELDKGNAVDAATAKLTAAQAEMEAAQHNLDIQTATLDAINKQVELMKELQKAITDLGQATTGQPLFDPVSMGDMQQVFDGIQKSMFEITAGFGDMQSAWSGVFTLLQQKFTMFLAFLMGWMPTVNSIWDAVLKAWNTVSTVLIAAITNIWEIIKRIWEQHGSTIMALTDFAFKFILAVISTIAILIATSAQSLFTILEGIFTVGSDLLKGDWKKAWDDTLKYGKKVWDLWAKGIGEAIANIADIFGINLPQLQAQLAIAWWSMMVTVQTVWNMIVTTIQGVIQWFGTYISPAWKMLLNADIVGALNLAWAGIQLAWEKIKAVFTWPNLRSALDLIFGNKIGDAIYAAILLAWIEALKWYIKFEDTAKGIISGFVSGLMANAFLVYNAVRTIGQGVINIWNSIWGIHSPSTVAKSWATNIMGTFTDTIKSMSDLPAQAFSNVAIKSQMAMVTPPMSSRQAAVSSVVNYNNSVNNNLNVGTTQSSQGVINDFKIMGLLA